MMTINMYLDDVKLELYLFWLQALNVEVVSLTVSLVETMMEENDDFVDDFSPVYASGCFEFTFI